MEHITLYGTFHLIWNISRNLKTIPNAKCSVRGRSSCVCDINKSVRKPKQTYSKISQNQWTNPFGIFLGKKKSCSDMAQSLTTSFNWSLVYLFHFRTRIRSWVLYVKYLQSYMEHFTHNHATTLCHGCSVKCSI